MKNPLRLLSPPQREAFFLNHLFSQPPASRHLSSQGTEATGSFGGRSGSPSSHTEVPVFRSPPRLPPATLPSAGLRLPSEPSWMFPGRRQVCPGCPARLPPGVLVGLSWAVTHVCEVLGLLRFSGKEAVNLLGPLGPVCPSVCVCVCAGTRRSSLRCLLVSHAGPTRVEPAWSRLPVQGSCSTHLGGFCCLRVLISDLAPSWSLIFVLGPVLFLLA